MDMRTHDISPADPTLTLSPEDGEALDALVDAGFDPERIDRADPARVSRLGGLLGLLRAPLPDEDSGALTDLTYLRVLRTMRRAERSEPEPELGAADEEALRSWVMSGYDIARVPGSLRERARRHEALAALATAPLADEPFERERLIAGTLDRVQAAIETERERMSFEGHRRRLGRFRLADVASVAAMLLIAGAVALPVLSSVRTRAAQAMCMAHLGSVGSALGLYASQHGDTLPAATAGYAGSWMKVGTPSQSNSANLFVLVRTNHVPLSDLACPGNPHAVVDPGLSPDARDWSSLEEVSYSYQIMFGGRPPSWETPSRTPVIADRSPVVLRVARRAPVDPLANSTNHSGRGQHLLYNDGSARWTEGPVLDGGDNIWLPRTIERRWNELRASLGLEGTELPAGADDVFLGP